MFSGSRAPEAPGTGGVRLAGSRPARQTEEEAGMANASRKHMGVGTQGKGDGTGAMTLRTAEVPDNSVLSNRDRASRSAGRGRDGKWDQVEQNYDSGANRRSADPPESEPD
jgi:hypothetical protein